MSFTIEINNSYCHFNGNVPNDIEGLVHKILTTHNDIAAEKNNLFFRMKYAKDKRARGMISAQIKKLEASEYVYWYKDKTFPTGHLNIVLDLLNELQADYKTNDKRERVQNSVVLKWANKPYPPRYYQEDMIKLGLKEGRGVLESAVGSGKSLILQYLIKEISVNSLVIVPSRGLKEQLYNELSIYFGSNTVQKIESKAVRSGNQMKPIRIVTIQTIVALQKSGDLELLISDIDALFVDEIHHCLTGSTRIKTDQGIKTIKEIVETKFKGKALSYNLKTKKFEFKKIVNWFEYEAPEELIELEYEAADGYTKTLRCTSNHKIYTTNRGYIVAGELTMDDDVVIDAPAICEKCEKEFKTEKSMRDHRGSHKVPYEVKRKQAQAMIESPNRNNAKARRLSSERMTRNNPSFNKETVLKQKIGRKKWWDNLPTTEQNRRITIFQNAPIHGVRKGPTRLETRLINLKIPELVFTGDGKFWLSSNGKRMNPDFKVKNKRKVVEVGDIEYWHTMQDINERINNYDNIEFECLYFTNRELDVLSDKQLVTKIKDFINGEATIHKENNESI